MIRKVELYFYTFSRIFEYSEPNLVDLVNITRSQDNIVHIGTRSEKMWRRSRHKEHREPTDEVDLA